MLLLSLTKHFTIAVAAYIVYRSLAIPTKSQGKVRLFKVRSDSVFMNFLRIFLLKVKTSEVWISFKKCDSECIGTKVKASKLLVKFFFLERITLRTFHGKQNGCKN